MRWHGLISTLVFVGLCGCGDDDAVGADGDATASGESGSADDPTIADDDAGDTGNGACVADPDCDDADPCTVDTCDAGTCAHEVQVSNACRPEIDVEFPARAATIVAEPGSTTVTVTGTVQSPLGDITSFTINGEDVVPDADGGFSHAVPARVGGNMLVLETTDTDGNARRRVQSFLWSTGYRKPMTPPDQPVPEGLAFWLGQESIDDGEHSQPLDDLATALELALGTFDTNSSPTRIPRSRNRGGYNVYFTLFEFGSPKLGLPGVPRRGSGSKGSGRQHSGGDL